MRDITIGNFYGMEPDLSQGAGIVHLTFSSGIVPENVIAGLSLSLKKDIPGAVSPIPVPGFTQVKCPLDPYGLDPYSNPPSDPGMQPTGEDSGMQVPSKMAYEVSIHPSPDHGLFFDNFLFSVT